MKGVSGCAAVYCTSVEERQNDKEGEKEELAALDEKANSPCREADDGAIACRAFVSLGQAA